MKKVLKGYLFYGKKSLFLPVSSSFNNVFTVISSIYVVGVVYKYTGRSIPA